MERNLGLFVHPVISFQIIKVLYRNGKQLFWFGLQWPQTKRPESTHLYTALLEIDKREKFFPNKLFKLPMLELINSGEQSPGKWFSFQLSSFWLSLPSSIQGVWRCIFLKHPSLSHTERSVKSHKRNADMVPSRWLLRRGFLSFSVLKRWGKFWFL